MTNYLKASLFGLVLMIPLVLGAQEQDVQVWTRVNLKYDPTENLRLYLEEDFRFRENVSHLDKNHTEIGIMYDLNDHWEVGGYYRLIFLQDEVGNPEFSHRYATQFTYTWRLDPWKIWLTPRFQSTYGFINRSNDWQIPENYLRNEVGFSWQNWTGRIEPFADLEFWYAVNRYKPKIVDQYRITVGLEYEWDRKTQWEFFLRYQQEIQVTNPDTNYILGISYTRFIR